MTCARARMWIQPWLVDAHARKNALYLQVINSPTTDNIAEYDKMKKYVDEQKTRDFVLEHTKPLFNKHNILSLRL